jgi:hypothetical protein
VEEDRRSGVGGQGRRSGSEVNPAVRVTTKLREMLRQSPLPYVARPSRNIRCSSSLHGVPSV